VVGYTPERLRAIAAIDEDHFWFAGRRALVARLIERHVSHRVAKAVDVGCGTGAFLPTLARWSEEVVGIDPVAEPRAGIVRGVAQRLPLDDGAADLVVALDVLEHTDDGAALTDIVRVLRPGGLLVLTVPALPGLWSERDVRAQHRRRYRKRELHAVLGAAGLIVRETTAFQFLLLPVVALSRVAGRRAASVADHEERPSRGLNTLFAAVNGLELRLGKHIRWPIGSTLAVAARKPDVAHIKVSVVVPVYRDASALDELAARVLRVLPLCELIVVDDGSPVETWDAINEVALRHSHVRALRLERNGGQHAAVVEGLRVARGDVVAVMDADLQDAPEALPVLIAAVAEGADAAFAARHGRFERRRRLASSRVFKAVLWTATRGRVPPTGGLFLALSADVARRVCERAGGDPYVLVLAARAARRVQAIPVLRAAAGSTVYTTRMRVRVARRALSALLNLPDRAPHVGVAERVEP